jgi:hypothetical protein
MIEFAPVRPLVLIAVVLSTFVSPSFAQTAARLKTGAGIVIYPVHSDKTQEFEALIDRVGQIVQRSDNPVRRQQARGWRVFRAKEPGPAGSVLYMFMLDPVVKLADYDVVKAMTEELPTEEADQFNRKWTGCLAGPHTVLDLQLVMKLAAAAGKPQKR